MWNYNEKMIVDIFCMSNLMKGEKIHLIIDHFQEMA